MAKKIKRKIRRERSGLRPYRRGKGWAIKRWQRIIGTRSWIQTNEFGWQLALIEVYKELCGLHWWRQRAILEDLIDASFLVPLAYRSCLIWPVKEVLAELLNLGTPELNGKRKQQNDFYQAIHNCIKILVSESNDVR